ncbi:MAG: glycosyltransferase [Leptolyngbya sp. SIO1D8]|nr:glycosyltransferase [Leptolyngbya sp. SIO1D8]
MIVLYAGNYHDAWQRIQNGQKGTWYGHQYMVEAFSKLREKHQVTILTCVSSKSYVKKLTDGTQIIEINCKNPAKETPKITKIIESQNPTDIIFRAPLADLWKWAIKQPKIRVMTLLAQSYEKKGIIQRIKNVEVTRTLNNSNIEWVFNHQVSASESLYKIGVNPTKIIPWDWPRGWPNLPEKVLQKSSCWNIFYAGAISEEKGVGDLIYSLSLLKKQGHSVKLSIAGKGSKKTMRALAEKLDIADSITFLGLVPNEQIIEYMHDSDFVCIPSRHSYPEGFPMTICEALASRTPIIASDHPMFRSTLTHQSNAMIFPEKNPKVLAENIDFLIMQPHLYSQISKNSKDAWEAIQLPVLWPELIERWVNNTSSDIDWFSKHSLSSRQYKSRLISI